MWHTSGCRGKYCRERNLREILDMMWGANGNNIQSRIPECPVRIVIIFM